MSKLDEVDGASKAVLEAVKTLKEEGWDPTYVKIAGREYLYRAITRKEWRDILISRNKRFAEAEGDENKILEINEDEQDKLVQMATLFPLNFDVSKAPAGVISTLSDSILIESGFNGIDMAPEKL